MHQIFTDEYFMRAALQLAEEAYKKGEVPIGAVVVLNNVIIAKAANQVETLQDITAHAEMLAITSASNYLGAKYLTDCTIYVTLEPCMMCASAIALARPHKLIFATEDEKMGYHKNNLPVLHQKTIVEYGILREEAVVLLKKFFRERR